MVEARRNRRRWAKSVGRWLSPFNFELIDGLNETCERASWQEACRWLLAECKVSLSLEGEFSAPGPQLIVFSEQSSLGAFIVGALFERHDLYYLATATGARLGGKATMERYVPLYLSQQPSPYAVVRFRNNYVQRYREGIDGQEARRRNAASLARAARLVDAGAALCLNATGGTGVRTSDWKNGVGALMRMIRAPQVNVVLLRTFGDRLQGVKHMANPRWFGRWIQPLDVRVVVHPPIPIAELKGDGRSADEMSEGLKRRHLEVFGSL